jgi:hypothetical protein
MFRTVTVLGLTLLVGCGGADTGDGGFGDTCDLAASECSEGLVCDPVLDGEARCATAVRIRGRVLDLADDTAIEGALVQAVDINGAAVGAWGASDSSGAFTLLVPAIRDDDGNPIEGVYTLRAQAAAYQEFPTAIRPALPLDVATAEAGEDGWVIENALTTLGLIGLPGDTSSLGSISGTVQAEFSSGILVVAESATTAKTGFSDSEGLYIVFNVPPGTYNVQGYAAGVQLSPATTTLQPGEAKTDVELAESPQPLSTVSGNVQIVNAPGDSQTSVVLSVESTFVEAAGRGAVPPGLRATEVTGEFSIHNVPDGRYVVLAAFENDGLVRDPDQTIGGTQIVRIEVPGTAEGNTINLPEGFKVTEALAVIAPGADGPEEVLTPTPTFEWEDDSSEDGYELRVLDAFGNEVWSDEIGPVTGSATVTHTYAGPDLQPDMFYQFRTMSFRERSGQRTGISTTEDLKGVFYSPGQ